MHNPQNMWGDIKDFVKDGYRLYDYNPFSEVQTKDYKSAYVKPAQVERRIEHNKTVDTFYESNNYMHVPTPDSPVLDFDDEVVQYLVLQSCYFSPAYSHGRNGVGHYVQQVQDPREMQEVKFLKVDGVNVAEIRFKGQTLAAGKYNQTEKSEEGIAFIKKCENAKPIPFLQMWQYMHHYVLISAFAKAYIGNFFKFRAVIVSELKYRNVEEEDAHNITQSLIDALCFLNPQWRDIRIQEKYHSETMKDVSKIYAKDHHDKFENYDGLSESWIRSVRNLIDEYYEPKTYEETKKEKKKNVVSPWEEVTAQELYATKFEEEEMLVEGFIGNGFNVLGGPPKVNKSFFALGLAKAIATGEDFLDRKVQKGHVKILALEDHGRRLQKRALLMGIPNNRNVAFIRKADKLLDGLEQQIEMAAQADSELKLIIIDTYQRSVDKSKATHGTIYEMDTEMLEAIQTLAQDLGICILVIHHTKKVEYVEGMDPFDLLSGSRGLQSMTDGMMVFLKNRGEEDAAIRCFGKHRDIADDIDIEIKMLEYKWVNLGKPEKNKGTQQEQNIHEAAKHLIAEREYFRPEMLIKYLIERGRIEGTKKDYASYRKKLASMKKKLIFVTGDRDGDYRYPRRIGEHSGEVILTPEDRAAMVQASDEIAQEYNDLIHVAKHGKSIF